MTRCSRSVLAASVAVLALAADRPCRAELSNEAARTLLRNTTEAWDLGDRVRVVSPGPYRVGTAGWFAGTGADSILMLRYGRDLPPLSIRLYQIGALEEKAGSKRHIAAGAVVGCVLGTVAGVLIANAHRKESADDSFQLEGLEQIYIPMGLLAGTVAGAALGYTIKTDRWREAASFE